MSQIHDKRCQIKVPPEEEAELNALRKLCPLPASFNSVGVAALKEGIPLLKKRLTHALTSKDDLSDN